jgi:hypothetical protein
VIRNLRDLKPRLQQLRDGARIQSATAMFWLSVLAILLQFVFPYVVLEAMGMDAEKLKVHPSTVLVVACGIYALVKGIVPLHQRCRESPGLLLFVFGIPLLNIYSFWFTGLSGAALYTESFWAAGMLALMLETASPEQRRVLARILITLCVINIFVALFESATATNWFGMVVDPDVQVVDTGDDFRASAFYNHPLTAALITSMSIYLLFAMRLRFIISGPIYGLLLLGLLAFGGRTALGVTLVMSALIAVYLYRRHADLYRRPHYGHAVFRRQCRGPDHSAGDFQTPGTEERAFRYFT